MTTEAHAHKYVTLLRDRDWRAAAAAHAALARAEDARELSLTGYATRLAADLAARRAEESSQAAADLGHGRMLCRWALDDEYHEALSALRALAQRAVPARP